MASEDMRSVQSGPGDEAAEAAESRRLDVVDLAYAFVGLASLWPFVSFSSQISLWTSAVVNSANALVCSHSVGLYSTFLALCFVALGVVSLRQNASAVDVRVPAVVFGLAGTVGVVLLSSAPENPVVLVIGLLGIAVYVATSVVAWGSWTAGGHPTQRIAVLLVAVVASCVLSMVARLLGRDLQVAYAVTPLLSFVLLGMLVGRQRKRSQAGVRAYDVADAAPAQEKCPPGKLADVWLLPMSIIVFAVCLLAITSVIVAVLVGHRPNSLSVGEHLFIAAATVSGALLMLCYVRLRLKTVDDLYGLFGLLVVFYGAVLALMLLMPAFGGSSLALRLCLVLFLWVVLAASCAWVPFFPPVGFSFFGLVAIAPMGMRLVDYEGFFQSLHDNSLFAPFIAAFVFVALCVSAFAIVRAHGRSKAPGGAQDAAPDATVAAARGAIAGGADVDQVPAEFAARMDQAGLTEREREVALLAVKGYTAKRIAEELVLSEYTAKNHLSGIYRKMGVASKQELIKLWEGAR